MLVLVINAHVRYIATVEIEAVINMAMKGINLCGADGQVLDILAYMSLHANIPGALSGIVCPRYR